jgi:hypothetical protein
VEEAGGDMRCTCLSSNRNATHLLPRMALTLLLWSHTSHDRER